MKTVLLLFVLTTFPLWLMADTETENPDLGATVNLLSGPPTPDENTVQQLVPWTFSINDNFDTDFLTFMFENTSIPFSPDNPLGFQRLAFHQAFDIWRDAETAQTAWKEVSINGEDWIVPLNDPPSHAPEPMTILLTVSSIPFLWLGGKKLTASVQ